mgnify:CR=1 FL=1|jgi:hypothetical protein
MDNWGNIMEQRMFKCVFIKQEYFQKNSDLVEILDPNNLEKQSQRKYIFFGFKYENNTILVPLRTNMPDISKIGQVGYKVPSEEKPNAGLDYRKMLIVNDNTYIEDPQYLKIPTSQVRIINANYDTIKNQIIAYLDGYIKSVKKGRHLRDKKFKYSTLHNFHDKLGI